MAKVGFLAGALLGGVMSFPHGGPVVAMMFAVIGGVAVGRMCGVAAVVPPR